jgi:hypothetical protein
MGHGTEAESFDEFVGLDLRRVVAAPRQDQHSVRVLAVELYADGVIARFLILGAKDLSGFAGVAGDDAVGRVSFSLDDDLGTSYRWLKTGSTLVLAGSDLEGPTGGVGAPILRGDAVFVPAVPPEATQLTIVTVEGLVEIPLAFV